MSRPTVIELDRVHKVRRLTLAEKEMVSPIPCTIDRATGKVTVDRKWARENIVRVLLPKAFGLPQPLWLHKLAAAAFSEWFADVEAAGVARCFRSINGSFVARLRRQLGAEDKQRANLRELLSMHARGLAVDFNAPGNRMGTTGAQPGDPWCLYPAVHLAERRGLVWGGRWKGKSCDPMHFELGALL